MFDALAENPFFGNASDDTSIEIDAGAHLYWMNRLALWGIPGFIVFLFMLSFLYKNISSMFDEGFRFYYLLSMTAFILIGLTKATGGVEIWLMLIVVIPGLYFLPLLEKNVIDNSNQRVAVSRF